MRTLLVCLFLVFSNQSISAGFDCGKATTKVEKSICANKDISLLDGSLSYNYKKFYKYKNEEQRSTFRTQQLAWIRDRDQNCKLSKSLQDCLKIEYEKRISEIKKQNTFLSKNMDLNEPKLLTFLKNTRKFDIGKVLPEYYAITNFQFIIAIDWGQAGRIQHGLYYVDLHSNVMERIISGYPNYDGIYKDKDRIVIVVISHIESRGLGWNRVSAIELRGPLISEHNIGSYSYYALDGHYSDECFDTNSSKGRLDVVGSMESLNIIDVDLDGYRDISLVVQFKDCNTLEKSKKTFTFASKKI